MSRLGLPAPKVCVFLHVLTEEVHPSVCFLAKEVKTLMLFDVSEALGSERFRATEMPRPPCTSLIGKDFCETMKGVAYVDGNA